MSEVVVRPPCGTNVGARWKAQPGKERGSVEFKCIHCGRVADLPERLCDGDEKGASGICRTNRES